MKLLTERLIIRDMKMSDLERFHPLANSEFVLKYLCMYKMSKEESAQYIQKMMEKGQDFAISLKESDSFIGKIHMDTDSLRYDVNSIELAYWLGEPYTRRGYMKEALSAFIEYLFNEKEYDSITVRALAPNTASIELLRSLGFMQEGYLHRALKYEGVIYDDVIFSLQKTMHN